MIETYLGFGRPAAATDDMCYAHFPSFVGRLKPGLSLSVAQAALQGLAPRLAADYPKSWKRDCSFHLYPAGPVRALPEARMNAW